jgi:hypothetical protein
MDDYGITHMFLDHEDDSGPYWSFPEDWQRGMSWHEACTRALRSALDACGDGAAMTIEGSVIPHDLTEHGGCVDDEGRPFAPGECGEPADRRFVVTVRDDTIENRWAVT